MKLTTFMKFMGLVTLLSLAYIHMQMQIFDLAYLGKDKEKMLHVLSQEKQNLTYAILRIKSANNLGYEMMGEDSGMQFVNPNEIIHISSAQPIVEEQDVENTQLTSVEKSPLTSFISFASRAEAKIQE